MKAKLVGIVAMTPERIIGKGGDLPWYLPEDLNFFKRTTQNHTILMGRKTFESIGKPLPKRKNIVLTRDRQWAFPNVKVIHSPEELAEVLDGEEQVFIIGGSEIYSIFLPHLDELIVTHVRKSYEGDVVFPEFQNFFSTNQILEDNLEFRIIKYSK